MQKVENGMVIECSCNDYEKYCVPCFFYNNCDLRYNKKRFFSARKFWISIALVTVIIWTTVISLV